MNEPDASAVRRPLSVLVTTFNEERNIADCLASVDWADEIVVVDSFSTDGTAAAARRADRFLQHAYESPARQKNWGLRQVRHRWVLILDADERATTELSAELRELLARLPELGDGPTAEGAVEASEEGQKEGNVALEVLQGDRTLVVHGWKREVRGRLAWLEWAGRGRGAHVSAVLSA